MGARSDAPAQLRFFPTVGFHPKSEKPDAPRFWTVRATVGVIGNVVVTVRLPNLWWNDEDECFDYTPGGPLDVAQRFFPNTDDLTADDVAEAIGLQQASTARAVSESIRTRLTNIERASRREVSGIARRDRKAKHENAHSVLDMTDTLYQLDRQLERLLASVLTRPTKSCSQAHRHRRRTGSPSTSCDPWRATAVWPRRRYEPQSDSSASTSSSSARSSRR